MRLPRPTFLLVVALAMSMAAGHSGNAASSSTVVSAVVPSASMIDMTSCPPGAALDFGAVLPGSSVVTSATCTVTFQSSNDTAALRMAQQDGFGAAMWSAGDGSADLDFDGPGGTSNGFVSFDVGAGNDQFEAVDSGVGGRVALAGTTNTGAQDDTLVALLSTTGDGVATFGGGDGLLELPVDPIRSDRGRAVAIDHAGRILVAGDVHNGTNYDAFVVRLLATGAIDPSFNGGAVRVVPDGGGTDDFRSIALGADGTITLAGKTQSGSEDVYVARLREDGANDPTFNGGAALRLDLGGWDSSEQVLRQPDGATVIVGNSLIGNNRHVVVRLLPDGSFDPAFDGDASQPGFPGNGIAFYDLAPTAHDWGAAGAIDDQGRIVVAGRMLAASEDVTIMRVTSTGALDTSFAAIGWRVLHATSGTDRPANRVLLPPTGGIVVAGYETTGDGDIFIRRLEDDGTDDSRFGTAGLEHVDSAGGADTSFDVALGHDGGILVAGQWQGSKALVARLAGGATIPQYLNGTNDFDQGAGAFAACLESIGGAAAATWAEAGACSAVDGPEWRAVTPTMDQIATTPTGATGSAALRFGLHAGAAQVAGDYVAPISFEVVAPS